MTVLERSLLEGLNLAMCVVLLASVLSMLGIMGGRLFRTSAYRHFWLFTTMVVILSLPIAMGVLPRWVYPDFHLPVLPDVSLLPSSASAVDANETWTEQFAAWGLPEFTMAGLFCACGVWLLGVIPSLARVAWGWARLKRVRLRGTPWRPPKRTADYLKKKYRVKRLPQVILSGQIQNALTVGIFHPQIMLHRRLVHELSSKQIGDVLDHEMAHVVRRDCLVMFLEQVARACHWCNPLMLWLCNDLARSREQMCDNTVLVQRPPLAYGETLLRVAELSLGGCVCRRFLAMLSRWSDLRWRMHAILDPKQLRSAQVGRRGAIAMIAGILFCGWLIGGVSFTTHRLDEVNDPRSQSDVRMVETAR